MADSYLEIAKSVLETRGRPMTAQQILKDASRHGLLPSRLTGKNMWKTLQARIAEDIFRNRSQSIFYRTGIGTYYLRSLSEDLFLPQDILAEFTPVERRRPPPQARVLCLADQFRAASPAVITRSQTRALSQAANSYHLVGQEPPNVYRVVTFNIVVQHGEILTHRVGKHSHFQDLVGQRTLGFRRYVDEFDLDLFGSEEFGFGLSSFREILRLLPEDKERVDDRPIRSSLSLLGSVIEPHSMRLSLVVKLDLVDFLDKSAVLSRRLDINDPQWLPPDSFDPSGLDVASTLILPELRKS